MHDGLLDLPDLFNKEPVKETFLKLWGHALALASRQKNEDWSGTKGKRDEGTEVKNTRDQHKCVAQAARTKLVHLMSTNKKHNASQAGCLPNCCTQRQFRGTHMAEPKRTLSGAHNS